MPLQWKSHLRKELVWVIPTVSHSCRTVVVFNISDRLLLAVPLSVAGAFHTSFMQPAVDKLKTALAEVEILTPRIPVVSNVDAKPHFDPEGDRY